MLFKALAISDPAFLYSGGGGGPTPGGDITTGGAADIYALPLSPVLTELDGLYLDAGGFLRTGAPPSDSILRLAYQSAETVFDGPPYALIIWDDGAGNWSPLFGVGFGTLPTDFIDALLPISGGGSPLSTASVPVQEQATIPGAHGPDPSSPEAGWTITYSL